MLNYLKLWRLPDVPYVAGSKMTEIALLVLSLLLVAYCGLRLSGRNPFSWRRRK